MLKWLKRILCHHGWLWQRNFYGDEINVHNGARSLWACVHCGKRDYASYLLRQPATTPAEAGKGNNDE